MKCLVFTAEGKYARFRRPYTTTSALTFSTLHPVAAKGIIGAIMGIDHSSLHKYTESMSIGIQVLMPICKDMQSFNLIAQASNNGAANFQSRVEFLRDVKYRIFLRAEEKLLEEIRTVMEKREFVFTPYLGCSEHIAKLQYEGLYSIQSTELQYCDTVLPYEAAQITEESGLTVCTDRIPIQINEEREYTEYKKIVFTCGKALKAEGAELCRVGEYNVFFL